MVDQAQTEVVSFGNDRATPTNERRPPLQARLVPVTAETLTQHFPQYGENGDSAAQADNNRRRLSEGLTYWAVAQDPEKGKDIGGIFVNLEQPGNFFSVGVNEPYQRRGVTKQLIQHAQGLFDHLSLDNVSGLGNTLYSQMGFKPNPDRPGSMIWIRQ